VYVVLDWVGALRLVQEQNLTRQIVGLGSSPSEVSIEIKAMMTLEERLQAERNGLAGIQKGSALECVYYHVIFIDC